MANRFPSLPDLSVDPLQHLQNCQLLLVYRLPIAGPLPHRTYPCGGSPGGSKLVQGFRKRGSLPQLWRGGGMLVL